MKHQKEIHEKLGLDFVTCTPGIRQASDSVDDQKRVVTPEKARELGSDYIVVGRSITRAQNPVETYQLINKQLGLWKKICSKEPTRFLARITKIGGHCQGTTD